MNAKTSLKRLALGGLTALSVVAMAAPAVSANDADIIRRGSCTNRSDWKLKLSPENGAIEVEFEVDTPRSGQTWRVKLWQDGVLFYNALKTTNAASGSFEVRRVRPNTAGSDVFKGRAVNQTTGEVCVGQATW
jgi:hypothetical protein